MISREDMGVYLFEGFLEAGKTSYIRRLLTDPSVPAEMRPLVILTEEGSEELEQELRPNMTVVTLSEPEEITPEKLISLEDASGCNTVILELNGMWLEQDILEKLPEHWIPFRKFTLADAGSFLNYHNNMRNLAVDKLRACTVVIFNRVTAQTDRSALHRIARAATRHVPIFFELPDGREERDELPDELPYDLSADIVEIADRDYAEWEQDISEEPEKYEGKLLRLRGFAVKSRDQRPGHFGFGRQVMTCCQEDIAFLGFPAICAPKSQPLPGSWVELTAQVSLQMKGGEPLPVLMVISCDPAKKPEDTLATFY